MCQLLDQHQLPPEALVLEITETAPISDIDRARDVIEQLRDLGVVGQVDDFGAGFTSLAYLGTLAVGELKLDRSFITELTSARAGRESPSCARQLSSLIHLDSGWSPRASRTGKRSTSSRAWAATSLRAFSSASPCPRPSWYSTRFPLWVYHSGWGGLLSRPLGPNSPVDQPASAGLDELSGVSATLHAGAGAVALDFDVHDLRRA